METTTFELTQAIAGWRRGLAASMTIPSECLDELETHLGDSIADFEGRGLTSEEAFFVAVGRVGTRKALASEFAKVSPADVWRLRCGWILAGIVFYVLALDLASVASGAAILLGNVLGIDGLTMGWVGMAGGTLVLGGIGFGFGRVASGQGATYDEAWARWRRKPVMLGLGLLTVLAGVKLAAEMIRVFIAYRLGPHGLGQVYTILGWGGLVGPFLLIGGLSLALAWLVRNLSGRLAGLASLLIGGLFLFQATGMPCLAQSTGDGSRAVKKIEDPTLDQAATLWRAGRKDESLASFVAVDFARRPLFPAGSILGYTEKQFIALPTPAREKLSTQLLAEVRTLKELGAYAGDRGQAAVRGGRKAEAEKYLGALGKCGEAFEHKDSLALLQKVGTAFRKLSVPAVSGE